MTSWCSPALVPDLALVLLVVLHLVAHLVAHLVPLVDLLEALLLLLPQPEAVVPDQLLTLAVEPALVRVVAQERVI